MRKRKRQKSEKMIISEPVEIQLEDSQVIGVLPNISEGSAIKFIRHRGYDKLLCEHVYFGFCPDCPQYKCKKRAL